MATTGKHFHHGITTKVESQASTTLCTYVTEFRAVKAKGHASSQWTVGTVQRTDYVPRNV